MHRGGVRSTVTYRYARAVDDGAAPSIRLSSNESAFGPLPSVVAAISHATTAVHRYPDPECTDLRAALAPRLGVPTDLIYVGPGSAAVLTQLVLATVSDGDRIVCPWPSFELYPILAQLAGGEFVRVPLRHHTVDTRAVAARLDDRCRIVVVANPNNPTGTAVPPTDVVNLLGQLPPGCLLVVDEAYADFSLTAPETGLPALVAAHPNLVVTRTFSKLHGLASLRIGYCVADPAVIKSISRLPPPFAVNGLAQAAALASLAAETELDERRREMVVERDRLVAAIRRRGWEVPDPVGNFVWIPTPRHAAALGDCLEAAGILTRVFDGDGVRITVGTAADTACVADAFPTQEELQ
jgi:histidinol-phosphate aminotransferase